MRLVRGQAPTIEADRAVTDQLLSSVADDGPAVRVWVPHRQVAFGPRDVRTDGYERARMTARERGFSPIERSVGGRAVAYDGETTLAFARVDPIGDVREGLAKRYERVMGRIERALSALCLEVERDEPPESFCPGTRSLSVPTTGNRSGPTRQKVVGLAQRVRQDGALTAGIVLVDGRDELTGVLEAVYDELCVPFDPGSVGTVAAAGGPADPSVVLGALETALAGDSPVTELSASTILESH